MVKVSVIVPTYKRPYLLQRCISSLIFQDFPTGAYELIIVTDGPDPETFGIVNEYWKSRFSNIGLHSLPFKMGPAAARNAGWRAAKGELILFTDDDCIPEADWVKNYYNAFEFYEETVIVLSGKITVPISISPTDFELNTRNLEAADFVTANCACSRAALEKVGGFDEAFKMAWREDSDLEFRLLKHGIHIKRIEEAEVVHPVRKAPWGISLSEEKKSMFNALLFKKHPQLYKQRICAGFLWNYYLVILCATAFLISVFYQKLLPALGFFTCWMILTGLFTLKRLNNTSHSFKHVTEMIFTSALIPFFSVFWNLYGAYKFKVFRL